MSWCDKLASTPTVGLRFSTDFVSSATILDELAPLLNTLVRNQRQLFSVTRQDTFGLDINTDDGFVYGFNQDRISVGFTHKMRVKPVSGGPPRVEMLSRPMPFTELLPEVTSKLLYATALTTDLTERRVERIGVVSTTIVADDELPPGLSRLIQHLGQPWPNGLAVFDCQLVTDLSIDSGQSDRCVHHLRKMEGEDENMITVIFDWQRTFPSGRSMTLDSLRSELASVQSAALAYFEDLAIGDMFDEVSISANS